MSNSIDGHLGDNLDGAGTSYWKPLLARLVTVPELSYASIWSMSETEPNESAEPQIIAETGVVNSQLFWAQRVECCLAASREPGSVPLVTQRRADGAASLVMSCIGFAKTVERIVLELQFVDGVPELGGTEVLKLAANELAGLGWAARVGGRANEEMRAKESHRPSDWVWNGVGFGIGGMPSGDGGHEVGDNRTDSAIGDNRTDRAVRDRVVHDNAVGDTVDAYREFVRQVHGSLDPQETSYAVANECRRLIGCERVTVLWWRRGRFVVKAISGQTAVNRRSKWVQLLERLAGVAVKSGSGLEYPSTEPLPKQIDIPLEAYLLESRSRWMTLLPVLERDPALDVEQVDLKKKRRTSNSVIAVLVFETLTLEKQLAEQGRTLTVAQEVGGSALRLSHQHRQLLFYPLWHFLGQTKAMALARRLPAAAIVGLVTVSLLALALFPATFYVSSEGTLVPQVRQRVFAPMDGIIESVLVGPNDSVGVGQPLLRMKNYDLDVRVRQVEGELAMVRAQMEVRNRRDRSPTQSPLGFADQLNETPPAVLKSRQLNLQTQLSLLQQQMMLSVVSSQVSGRVLTWNVQEELKGRPVPMGRLLMEVADTDGRWELELNLPDRRVGHLLNAVRQQSEPLAVEFVMAAEPTRRFTGRVLSIAPVTGASTEDGSYVKVRVELESDDVRVLQTNTDVSAKIICGKASLGYVWLQDVFEFVERQVFFYLW
ncbi:MAG: HlyD family efflux transporter periplasmic adaptor subunit [Pirellulaceae bacterium]|nr:HlyD family efflux transporter periplasmic adaptor subunit [Pirellulaceae bacterium]